MAFGSFTRKIPAHDNFGNTLFFSCLKSAKTYFLLVEAIAESSIVIANLSTALDVDYANLLEYLSCLVGESSAVLT